MHLNLDWKLTLGSRYDRFTDLSIEPKLVLECTSFKKAYKCCWRLKTAFLVATVIVDHSLDLPKGLNTTKNIEVGSQSGALLLGNRCPNLFSRMKRFPPVVWVDMYVPYCFRPQSFSLSFSLTSYVPRPNALINHRTRSLNTDERPLKGPSFC